MAAQEESPTPEGGVTIKTGDLIQMLGIPDGHDPTLIESWLYLPIHVMNPNTGEIVHVTLFFDATEGLDMLQSLGHLMHEVIILHERDSTRVRRLIRD